MKSSLQKQNHLAFQHRLQECQEINIDILYTFFETQYK